MARTKKNTQDVVAEVKTTVAPSECDTEVVEPKKVKFDAAEFAVQIENFYKDNSVVDVVADSHLENPRALQEPDFQYLHFFKKGTVKDLFKMYNSSRGTRFAIATTVAEFITPADNFTSKPKMKKNKAGEERAIYIDITCSREDSIDVANTIIAAYEARDNQPNEVTE